MGHSYAVDTTTYCRLKSLVRSNVFEDADLVGGNVEFWLEWENGAIRPELGWPAGTSLRQKPAGIGAGTEKWSQFYGQVLVDGSGRAYGGSSAHNAIQTTGFSAVTPLFASRTSMDMSCTVTVGSAGAGIAWRMEGDNDGFFAYFNVAAGKAVIDKRVAIASDTRVLTGTTAVSTGQTYTLRMTVTASNVWELFVNGVSQGTFTDSYNSTKYHWGIVCKDTNSLVSNIYAVNSGTCPATTYDVINDDGVVITSGSVSGYKLSIPDSALVQGNGLGPYGGYKVRLYGASVGNYGTAKGDCQFVRVRTPINTFGPKPSTATDPDEFATTSWDIKLRAFFGMGATRLEVGVGDVAGAAAYLKNNYVAYAHASRPRYVIGAFAESNPDDATGMTASVNSLKSVIGAWEPLNEPNFTYNGTQWAAKQQTFYNAVKAADSSAIALGPNHVSYNYNFTTWAADFHAAGGTSYLNQVSMHGYNCSNGDISMTRRLLDFLAARSMSSGKALWQTEQSHPSQQASLCMPRHALNWTAVQLMVQETRGIPIERNVLWYDLEHGYAVTDFWECATGINSVPVMVRNMMDEIGNRTFSSEFDLGSMADHYVAAKWTGTDSTSTVGLLAQSVGQAPLRFYLNGASSVTTVDAWGNTSTKTKDGNGIVSFTVGTLPTWVRVPSGVSLTIVPEWTYGTNLALAATVTASSGTTYNAGNLVSEFLENQYDRSGGDPATGVDAYNYATVGTLPITITIALAAPSAPTKMVMSAMPPWQTWFSTPTDFDIQYSSNGSTWTTAYTHSPSASVTSAFVSDLLGNNSTHDTWFNPKIVWSVDLPGTTITHVRMVVRDCSWGGHETSADATALWGGADKRLTPRSVRLYNFSPFVDTPTTRYFYKYP